MTVEIGKRVAIDLSNSDYDSDFIKQYHQRTGLLVEIVGSGADTLYCVEFTNGQKADFATTDLREIRK